MAKLYQTQFDTPLGHRPQSSLNTLSEARAYSVGIIKPEIIHRMDNCSYCFLDDILVRSIVGGNTGVALAQPR